MKQLLFVICLLNSLSSFSQYYLRGNVIDEKGRVLEGAKIYLYSKGTLPFSSGNNGLFGIPVSKPKDTITIIFDGYEIFKKEVDTRLFQNLVLKMLPATASLMKHRLSSRTTNLLQANQQSLFASMGESYSNYFENELIESDAYPETGFALNVDRASYSNIRRFINNQSRVPTDAVRIEEMLNYFNLKNPSSQFNTTTFNCETYFTNCPWNNNSKILSINIIAPRIDLEKVPPTSLVFLIDVSGSMDKPNRLPLLQTAFKLLVENIRDKDSISIITYGGGVHVALAPTNGSNKQFINNIIDSLYADGDTPGENALRIAYDIAKSCFIKNGNNRIVLATDGDFNVGQTSEKDLEELISFQRQSGIYLTCLGVGMGNYKDSKLETLAKKGNGNFAYLDNIQEAEKVLVTEFTKTIYAVANDAYLNVQFNKEVIKKYRLIGFDNKKDAISDSTSELEGGEVGSGHNLMALFEVELADSFNAVNTIAAKLNLQYRSTNKDCILNKKWTITYKANTFNEEKKYLQFANAVVMAGQLLRQSNYIKGFSFNDVLKIAEPAADITNKQQIEFLTLLQKAEKIYNLKSNKKKY